MALDGIVVSNIVYELNKTLADGRINKIAQPENDELMFTVKAGGNLHRVLISANPSLPLIYMAKENKPSPLTAPNFCMVLRKHIGSARIVSVTQPSLERIIDFEIEHFDELGDLRIKHLVVELMGKHSNIIFTDSDNRIIDSIKHVSSFVSSVREVLPGREYFIPLTDGKLNPFKIDKNAFNEILCGNDLTIQKALYTKVTGLSPLAASVIAYNADLDADRHISTLDNGNIDKLYTSFDYLRCIINEHKFTPNVVYDHDKPIEFGSYHLSVYENFGYSVKDFDSILELLYVYYSEKNMYTRIHQKSADLRKICQTMTERTARKLDLQLKQLKDTEKRDKYKVYGDLLMSYSYDVKPGEKTYTCENFYNNNETVTIPLNPDLSATDNGKKYYDKFAKLKRTFIAVNEQLEDTRQELSHLESISNELDLAVTDTDLDIIKKEMTECGYIKAKHNNTSKKNKTSQKSASSPIHYITDEGYHIYVGRNNYQNDELTFKISGNSDWWFHSKTIAGSHVILKSNGDTPSDKAFEQAAKCAAYYSKGKNEEKVEIDYIMRKHVKKPNGAKPGFVIYHTNYSMVVTPDISQLQEVK